MLGAHPRRDRPPPRAARVVVEVDGWAYHRDRERRNALVLVLAGGTVLRVNWHDLETDRAAVLATIRAAIGAAAVA